jgi:hypothetical protein
MPARLFACCLTVLGALTAHVATGDWLIDQRQQDGSFATAALVAGRIIVTDALALSSTPAACH